MKHNDSFFGKTGCTVQVVDNDLNTALRKLKRKVEKEGVYSISRRATYEKPSDAKRRKMKKAQHNERKRQFRQELELGSSFVDYIDPRLKK